METPTLVRMLIKAGGPHTDGNIGLATKTQQLRTIYLVTDFKYIIQKSKSTSCGSKFYIY
ncbi:hypothetical protein WN944_027276 [Citrus x changshan-huyou]|uniref:Uncharacterized protein n=1 Tax=Citrus x changshan-huyou TaxID=2935761 RepID=A0AAP0LKJ4_9ROSI